MSTTFHVSCFGVTAVGSEEGKGAGGSNSQATNIKTKELPRLQVLASLTEDIESVIAITM